MSIDSHPRVHNYDNDPESIPTIRLDQQTNPSTTPKWVKWGGAGLIAAIGISGAAYGIGYMGKKGEIDAQYDAMGADRSASASHVPTVPQENSLYLKYDTNQNHTIDRVERDTMAPEDYLQLDEETRAADRAERFNEYLYTAWETIQPNLTPEERAVLYMPDLNKPRNEWSDQDYLNYETLSMWLVTTQGTSQEASNEGLRALSVVARPGTNAHNTLTAWINQNPGAGYKEVFKAKTSDMSGKEISNFTLEDGIQIGPEGGRLVGYESMLDHSQNFILYANRADDKGNTLTISEDSYDNSSWPGLQSLLEKYRA